MRVASAVCRRAHIDPAADDDVLIRRPVARFANPMTSVSYTPTQSTVDQGSDVTLLRARVEELTRERDQMAVAVDLLQAHSSSLHFTEILQRIAKRLGDLFGLDRCSIYLAGDIAEEVRMVATFENPELSNFRSHA